MADSNLTDVLRDAIPLMKCRDYVPGRPHSATIWRWALKGCRGVKLATWMAGGKRVTTPAALEAFLRRLNPDAAPDDDSDTDAETLRQSRAAGDALRALGC